MAQWLVRRTVERLGGGAVDSIPTVGVCQLTAIFQHLVYVFVSSNKRSFLKKTCVILFKN